MGPILIANADCKFSEVLRRVLAAYHHEVVLARTGEEALHLFKANPPALVVLDLALPGGAGLEVLAKICARARHVPVIILTGDVSLETENRAREMGVTDVLRKQHKMDVIMHAISRVLQEADKPAPGPTVSATPLRKGEHDTPPTILVVDDEPEIGELVGEFLRMRGYRIRTATSGEQALTIIKQAPPDLVLLDMHMPGSNGVEVLRRLKESNSQVGVVMLTASQDEHLFKTAMELGVFDVLSKPVDLGQIDLAVLVKLAMADTR